MRDLAAGLSSALVVGLLGLLAVKGGFSSHSAAASIHELATLLALLFGILSAVWWHQSANLANELIDSGQHDPGREKNANTLSAAAATTTALALIASVLSGLPWPSSSGWLCALGFELLVAMSGDDLRHAGRISMREHLRVRAVLGFVVLGILLAVFVWQRLSD